MSKFSTVEDLGPKQSFTHEGFLIIRDVPIARTGEQIYGPYETPIAAGADGLVHIMRDEAEVFRDQTISSLEGKDIVDEHPGEEITPDNWRDLTIGHLQNVRRGVGEHIDHLVGDFVIKCPAAIKAVRDGKRQVSCGYRAEYVKTGDGRGRQTNIIGNHVALVKQGRCGPSCAIGDKDMPKQTMLTRLRKAFSAADDAALIAALDKKIVTDKDDDDDDDEGKAHVEIHNHMPGSGSGDDDTNDAAPIWFKKHVDDVNAKFTAFDSKFTGLASDLKAIKDEAEKKDKDDEDDEETKKELKAEAGDKSVGAKDSAFLGEVFQETAALAEVIAPGIHIMTMDAKAAPKLTLDAICSLRRKSLDLGYMQADTRGFIETIMGGRAFDTKAMTCDALRTIFRTVGAMKKNANNNAGAGTRDRQGSHIPAGKASIRSVGDLSNFYKEKYKQTA